MKTAMQELLELIPDAREIKEYISENQPDEKMLDEWLDERMFIGKKWLEKEKEQLIAAVRYGQNNHTENVYEEGEVYYNEIYNSDTQFIKSSIPNGNIEITKTNNL